ncbi:MAG: amidohydrolase [Micropruina sp.]|uniref:amidohydrolase n=1 Tax=Micropruina sp. TaxID=2737536 RepID=UPI0039E4212F
MDALTIGRVRPWAAEPVDIVIRDGLIAEIGPAGEVAGDGDHLDGAGLLALPGFVNAHAHVDKSWWGKPWVSYGGEPTTQGRIAHERAERDRYGIPDEDATVAALGEFLRHGTTATRSHVDVDLGVGLRGLDVVRAAAARMGGAVDVQLVAFPQDGVIRRPGVLDLLDRAAAEGVQLIGGIDPCTIDFDPVAQLDGLFRIAERHGVGIDIHLHDGGALGAWQYRLLIDRTRASGLRGRVNVSHGFALGDLEPDDARRMVDELAEAGISWTTVAPPRTAPLPWRAMRNAGVPLGLGTDGIRDLWSPFGDGDLLRVAQGFARLHGLRRDEDLGHAVELATRSAAGFVDRPVHDLVVGARADLVLLDAENVPDALVRAPRRELVVAGGRIVARHGALVIDGGISQR